MAAVSFAAATTAATATTFTDPHVLTLVYPESPLDNWLYQSVTGPYEGYSTYFTLLPYLTGLLQDGQLIDFGYQACSIIPFNAGLSCASHTTYYPGHDGGDVGPLDSPNVPTVPEPGPCGTILMGALFLGLKYGKRAVR